MKNISNAILLAACSGALLGLASVAVNAKDAMSSSSVIADLSSDSHKIKTVK